MSADARFKAGDLILDPEYPEYTAEILRIEKGLYFYKVSKNGKTVSRQEESYKVESFDSDFRLRKLSKLELALK